MDVAWFLYCWFYSTPLKTPTSAVSKELCFIQISFSSGYFYFGLFFSTFSCYHLGNALLREKDWKRRRGSRKVEGVNENKQGSSGNQGGTGKPGCYTLIPDGVIGPADLRCCCRICKLWMYLSGLGILSPFPWAPLGPLAALIPSTPFKNCRIIWVRCRDTTLPVIPAAREGEARGSRVEVSQGKAARPVLSLNNK